MGWLASRSELDELPGVGVLLYESEKVALETTSIVRTALLVVTVFLCLGLAGLLLFVSRQVSKPISSLLEQIAHVRKTGDLSARVEEEGPRELARLGNRFNSMLTELQQTTVSRQRFQDAQQQLELALEGGNIGLWDWNTHSDEVYYSPILKRQLGYSGDEDWNSFADWESRLHPDDHEEAVRVVQNYLERRVPIYESTFRLRCIDGTYRTILAKAAAEFDGSGKPQRMTGVHIDVTERVRAQERMRAVIKGATTGMVMVDEKGKILLVNSQLEATFGYTREELLDESIEMLLPVDSRHGHVQERSNFMAQPEVYQMGRGRELTGLHQSGDRFPIEVGLNPILLETGMCVLATVVDVTDRKRAEDALRTANENLARSNAELEQFAYVASHDLQEPLRKVSAFCQLLVSDYGDQLDEQGTQYAGFIIDGADRMRRLIQDLLRFTRISNVDLATENVDVNEIFDIAVSNLSVAIEEASAVVTKDELPTVSFNHGQMTHLLQNLIGNALKYRQKDVSPKIHVSSADEGERWVLSVADNGIGIDPMFHEKVFGVFKRLHRREEYDGTGIGLALCKRIIERFGGTIWVESTPGAGSTFHVTVKKT